MKLPRNHRCPVCGVLHGRDHSYCLDCHARFMRKWRTTHPPTEEQRLRSNARSYARVYLKRGKLKQKPCAECGSKQSNIYHEDYSKPLEVTWLCRGCRLARKATA